MQHGENTLRRMVDKWLGHCMAGTVRLIKFGRTADDRNRYVRMGDGKSMAIVFFRHRDGSWKVFPPRRDVVTMSACRLAA